MELVQCMCFHLELDAAVVFLSFHFIICLSDLIIHLSLLFTAGILYSPSSIFHIAYGLGWHLLGCLRLLF